MTRQRTERARSIKTLSREIYPKRTLTEPHPLPSLILAIVIGLIASLVCFPALRVRYVDLSRSAANAVIHSDGSWTVTTPGTIFGQIVCSGNYVNPEIVARGPGTAVHYGIKFYCSDPVSFSIQLGIDDFYDSGPGPGSAVSRHSGGANVEKHGVAAEPYVEGFSLPCVNNLNSGWEIWDRSSLGDQQKHNARSTRRTVGCRV